MLPDDLRVKTMEILFQTIDPKKVQRESDFKESYIRAIGAFKSHLAIEPLLAALMHVRETNQRQGGYSGGLIDCILNALAQVPDAEMYFMLEMNDPEISREKRCAAMIVYSHMAGKNGIRHIHPLLQSKEPQVAKLAASILEALEFKPQINSQRFYYAFYRGKKAEIIEMGNLALGYIEENYRSHISMFNDVLLAIGNPAALELLLKVSTPILDEPDSTESILNRNDIMNTIADFVLKLTGDEQPAEVTD